MDNSNTGFNQDIFGADATNLLGDLNGTGSLTASGNIDMAVDDFELDKIAEKATRELEASLEQTKQTKQAVKFTQETPQVVVKEAPAAVELEYTLSDLLQVLRKHDASDLHLKEGSPPMVRINGDLFGVGESKLNSDQCRELIFSACNRYQVEQLCLGKEVDVAYSDEGTRFRINGFLQKSSFSASIRMLRTNIPTFDDLHLPTQLADLVSHRHGLVLVTGPASVGKSTTLAAMVDYINSNQAKHIISIEDPIEYIHASRKSLITQREVGSDTTSFQEGLKHALRQDPDVLLIGEMRDPETIFIAAQAAETGHLVLSTLHTPNTVQAISRVIDVFTGDNQKQIRLLLASNLRGVISQRLLTRADMEGRIPAVEILIVTPTISSLILEERVNDIYQFIARGQSDGMQTLNQSLYYLCERGLISHDDAMYHSEQPTELRMMLEGHISKTYSSGDEDMLISWI